MKFRFRLPILHCAILCATASFSLPALSANSAMDDLLNVLHDKGTITASEYEIIKKSTETTKESARVKTGTSGLKLSSSDGNFKFQLGGRVMIDTAFYNKDSTSLGNGAEIRRARLFAKGTAYDDWFYKVQLDFAGNSTSLKDVYMGYSGLDSAKIKIGHFKEPFSIEEQTSSKYITFMERGLPNAFSPGRNTGLAVSTHGKTWGAAAGYFFDGVKNSSSPESQGTGATGRIHFAPLAGKTRVIHLGAAASFRSASGDNEIRFRERPESHVTSTRLVDTSTISNYDNQTLYGLEAAAVFGSFSLQGEYMLANVDVSGAGSDPDFNGWYIFASYFLSGEHRPYKVSSGSFGRVKPDSIVGQGGTGAWEVAVRYSSIDLQDSGYTGGAQNDITLGVNWYATPNVRFMMNYVHASTNPTSPTTFAGTGDENINIIQLRGQVDF